MIAKRVRYVALFAALGVTGLTSCGKKEKEVSGEPEVEKVAAVVAETPPAAEPAAVANPSARAAKLGFAKHLPAETHMFMGWYDGAGFVKELRGSKLGAFVESMAAEQGMDLDEVSDSPQAQMGMSLFKEEFFVAVGQGADKQVDNLLAFQQVNNFHQMKGIVKIGAAAIGGGEFDEEDVALGGIKAVLNDPKLMETLLTTTKMPPVYIGCKISDEEARNGLSGMIAGGLGEFLSEMGPDGEDVGESVEIPNGDTPLKGIRLVGKKIAAKLKEEGDLEEMEEVTSAANVERILKAIAERNIVVASGVIDNYVVVFLGDDVADFALAESPAKSLVSTKELSFVDGYLGKNLMLVSSISQSMLKTLGAAGNGLGNMAMGVKAGLGETDVFGDTQDLEMLLELVAKQEKVITESYEYYPAGMVLYRDKGYKLETFGGSNRPDLNLAAKHDFGKLADWDGALLYAGAIADEKHAELLWEYLDTLGETAYLAAKKSSALDLDDGDFAEYKEMFGLFDSMFKADLLALWKTLRDDVGAGMGAETAILVDLKGGLPTAPGLAEVLIEKATAPRIAVIAPVKDREKLGEAWKNINGSMVNLLKSVSEMSGTNMPMQKPMTSEKDDLTTWFFNIPFQTDDFMLSTSLDDKNFYATTSKSFTKELSATLKEGGGSSQTGSHLRVNFSVLLAYINDTLIMVGDNAEEVFGGNAEMADGFKQELPEIQKIVGAMSELKDLRVHTREEGGRVRTSIHLNIE